MKKIIEINGKPMEFEATAMTDHMADHIFHINTSYAVQHAQENEDKLPLLICRLAFVMNKRAELGGWRAVENLTEEDFLDWLDTFDSYDIEMHGKEILGLYVGNKDTSVHPKNTQNPPAES